MPNFEDRDFFIVNSADPTKMLRFDLSSLTTGAQRTESLQDANGTVMLTSNIDSDSQIPAGNWIFNGTVEFNGALDQRQASSFCGITGALPASVIYRQTADKTVANTTTETSIIGTGVGTLPLPANFLIPGRTLRLTFEGVYSTVVVTGDTVTIKIYF